MEDPSFSFSATYFLLGFQSTVIISNDLKIDIFLFIKFILVILVNKITQVSRDLEDFGWQNSSEEESVSE